MPPTTQGRADANTRSRARGNIGLSRVHAAVFPAIQREEMRSADLRISDDDDDPGAIDTCVLVQICSPQMSSSLLATANDLQAGFGPFPFAPLAGMRPETLLFAGSAPIRARATRRRISKDRDRVAPLRRPPRLRVRVPRHFPSQSLSCRLAFARRGRIKRGGDGDGRRRRRPRMSCHLQLPCRCAIAHYFDDASRLRGQFCNDPHAPCLGIVAGGGD